MVAEALKDALKNTIQVVEPCKALFWHTRQTLGLWCCHVPLHAHAHTHAHANLYDLNSALAAAS